MTTRTILGINYFEVPSTRCRSNIAGLKCGLYESLKGDEAKDPLYNACLNSGCAAGKHQQVNICFLTAEQYARWTAARLTA